MQHKHEFSRKKLDALATEAGAHGDPLTAAACKAIITGEGMALDVAEVLVREALYGVTFKGG